jgi:hypothetical protein
MSNIKTRKGLAFGALVALGASLIAGAPAHAAGELNVVPAAGTLLSTLSTETFTLNTNFTGANATPVTTADLRFQVKSASAIALGQGSSEVAAQNDVNNVTLTSGAIDVASATQTSANNFLAVALQSSLASGTVEVTAYVDSNNSGTFTAGEWNAVQTISFKTLASVATAVNLDTPHAGDTHVTGQVTLDGINASQVQSGVSVNVATYDSTANARTYSSIGGQNSLPSTLKFDVSVGGLTAGDNLAVRAQLATSFDLDPEATSFAIATKKVVAHTVFHIAAEVVASANARADGDVRANSPYVVSAKVTDNSSPDNLAVAGAAVKAEVTRTLTAALSATRTVTINGTTYTSNADLDAASIALTSGADGKVNLNVTSTGFVTNDILSFHFTSENLSDTVSTVVVDLSYKVVDVADTLNNDARSAVAGSTTNVTYYVVDQFGQAAANGKFAVQVEGDSITTAHTDVVNGSATVPVAVAATPAVAQVDVEATLYAYSTNEHSFVSAAPALNTLNEDGFTLYVAPSNEITAATVVLNAPADSSYNVDSQDKFGAHDGRYDGLFGYAAAPSVDCGSWAYFTGTVKAGDVATHTIAGASVTISAPGLLIKSGDEYGVGTLTVLADAFGNFNFYVSSHKSGDQTVTVTSGAASKSGTAKTWAPLAASTVSAAVASASYTTGRAVLVEFTTADKYGNASAAASVTITAAGAGYLVAGNQIGSSVTLNSASGKVAVQLINGADQIGSATVTASIVVGDATKTAATTYTFGQTDANLNISGKRVTADWVFAAGKTVSITRDGVTIRTFHPTANSADSFSFNLKKSKHAHRVTIKVNGVTITDAGYLVKK